MTIHIRLLLTKPAARKSVASKVICKIINESHHFGQPVRDVILSSNEQTKMKNNSLSKVHHPVRLQVRSEQEGCTDLYLARQTPEKKRWNHLDTQAVASFYCHLPELGLFSIFGVRVLDKLKFEDCVPKLERGFSIEFTHLGIIQ